MEGILKEQQKKYHMGLLPPQTPAEYVDDQVWQTGNAMDEQNWLGHGYYWKYGTGQMDKDLGTMDYDTLEDNFYHLKKAKVLAADYSSIKRNFPIIESRSDTEINTWLIEQAAFISEGQKKRMSEGGDMHNLIDVVDPEEYLDFHKRKVGLRMKGGGRAATFFVDNKYWFEDGVVQADMLEVKGCGTTILQPGVTLKASGFLSLSDAMKEFAYQKLIQQIADIEKQDWGTVIYYAIIDTGIKFKPDTPSPSTGYKGDSCVLVIRQRQSRIVSCFDEVVFYSVCRRAQLQTDIGKRIRNTLTKWGISSEQLPVDIIGKTYFKEEVDGDWNVQADANMTHLVDFSHWYTLPTSPLHISWKMSENAFFDGLKLGGPMLNIFDIPQLTKFVYGTEDANNAREIWEKEKPYLETKYKGIGAIGKRKPEFSWSWFLEVDDSPIMKLALMSGTTFNFENGNNEFMKTILSFLPTKQT